MESTGLEESFKDLMSFDRDLGNLEQEDDEGSELESFKCLECNIGFTIPKEQEACPRCLGNNIEKINRDIVFSHSKPVEGIHIDYNSPSDSTSSRIADQRRLQALSRREEVQRKMKEVQKEMRTIQKERGEIQRKREEVQREMQKVEKEREEAQRKRCEIQRTRQEVQRKREENQRIMEENQRIMEENQRIMEENQRIMEENHRIREENHRIMEINRTRRLEDMKRQTEEAETIQRFPHTEATMPISKVTLKELNEISITPDHYDTEGGRMDPPICTICYENMLTKAIKLPCNHLFHSACLSMLLSRHTTCPLCREPIQ
ncbi:unnamed protein product [Moneuplotes crassus]|uniref:RING-type domain-containing protein n=1 Tax=Euplotes crassus TaxID=5936 RepID=A0AAD2CZY5_EUPCR|nr:unnamed protein product [Moneuplotes crassus]